MRFPLYASQTRGEWSLIGSGWIHSSAARSSWPVCLLGSATKLGHGTTMEKVVSLFVSDVDEKGNHVVKNINEYVVKAGLDHQKEKFVPSVVVERLSRRPSQSPCFDEHNYDQEIYQAYDRFDRDCR